MKKMRIWTCLRIFGRHVTTQLKKLSLKHAICAQKEIQSTLLWCRLNTTQFFNLHCGITESSVSTPISTMVISTITQYPMQDQLSSSITASTASNSIINCTKTNILQQSLNFIFYINILDAFYYKYLLRAKKILCFSTYV